MGHKRITSTLVFALVLILQSSRVPHKLLHTKGGFSPSEPWHPTLMFPIDSYAYMENDSSRLFVIRLFVC